MVQITVEIDTSKLTEKLTSEKIDEVREKGMSYAAQEVIRTLMMNSPVDHGLLKMWFAESISADEANIKSPAYYARFVNDGTRPYTITPKGQGLFHAGKQLTKGSALWWEGAPHPVKVVHHPGIKGQHFVEKSIDDVSGRLDGYFLKAIQEVLG